MDRGNGGPWEWRTPGMAGRYRLTLFPDVFMVYPQCCLVSFLSSIICQITHSVTQFIGWLPRSLYPCTYLYSAQYSVNEFMKFYGCVGDIASH